MKFIVPTLMLMGFMLFNSCDNKTSYTNFNDYPTPVNENLWIQYTPSSTLFKIWSPTAQEVILRLYKSGNSSKALSQHQLLSGNNGIWQKEINGNLDGVYYTYQVKIKGAWLAETPGIYAQAVGVNGKRAMILDIKTTNPKNWELDQGPKLNHPNEAIIYEMHLRDLTILAQSGVTNRGTYTGATEIGTKNPQNRSTGLDHIKELGVTHVHLLPTFDHYSIDESQLDKPQYNWGYDPNNYNVPEGSFSTDPYRGEVRIAEFKQMVKNFHDQNIGVIMDVVYNHTGKTTTSNFNLEVPDYYYRQWQDGTYADAAACGNETASERAMMRKFMLASIKFWIKEYHIDGFRFDLMGIHDIETMNQIAQEARKINPNIIIYGEGWTAKESPLPYEQRALKKHMQQLPHIAAFNDDLRDALKGSVFDDKSLGFVNGALNTEESIKFGIVGAISHPQINYSKVNYSDAPYTLAPWQSINYVSCHDNHTLFDKLKISRPKAGMDELIAMDKLANAIVLTSQGTPFLHAGSEMLRTKKGAHNSYNLPDSINQLDWDRKQEFEDVFEYYKNLIQLRKAHPAFAMKNANEVRDHLKFHQIGHQLVSFTLENNANGDYWNTILVVYNASAKKINYKLDGIWQQAVSGSTFDLKGSQIIKGTIDIPAMSMYIAFKQ
ncbi:type I pullulanase [Maribacter sedimenticola]|nr:type I pullulanase [Maribacter sedimenticola]